MAQLGINPAVDDISSDHLSKLRKELAPLLGERLDTVMIRVADTVHDACTDSYNAGHYYSEAAARGAVLGEPV